MTRLPFEMVAWAFGLVSVTAVLVQVKVIVFGWSA